MKSTHYPSDLTATQFQMIQVLLESVRKTTKPRRVELYDIFNAVLYLLKTGCQWRMLPKDYPNWKLVHYYFTLWRSTVDSEGNTVLDQALKKNGWRGPTKTGAEIGKPVFNR
jgi:transposase